MERDSSRRSRDGTRRDMTADAPEKLNRSIGGAGRAGFSRRAEAAREPRSAPVSVLETVARHRRQTRREDAPPDAISESGLPDVGLPDESTTARLPRTEDYTHFGQRSDPRGDAGPRADAASSARTQRGTMYSRKFEETPVKRRDVSGDTEPRELPRLEYTEEALSRTDAPAEPARTEQHGASEQLGDVGASVREALSNLERPERPFDSRPGRLRFGAEEKTPAADAAPPGKKLTRARSKAERSSEKLVNAREKLPTKRRVRSRQIFDEKKSKPRREIYFEKGIKTQREHLKGPAVTRPVKAAGNAAVAYGHRKLYQAEHENAAVKAAHRGEALAEAGLRGIYRHHKTAPYRKAGRLTGKTAKLNMKAGFRQAVYDNPELKSNLLSRMAQKRKIKKQYAKAAREAKKNAGRVKKAGDIVGRAAGTAVRIVARHPLLFALTGGILLLFFLFSALFASCSNIFAGAGASVTSAMYLAKDSGLDGAELLYTELETDLQLQIMNTERDRPGFDEYRYSVDDISHNPYELLAYLTARFQEFTLPGVDGELRELFAEQYALTFVESAETRYRTVVRIDPDTDESYEELEAYDRRVLTITLTARSFTDVVTERMSAEQLRHYNDLIQTKGGRRYAGNPLGFGWTGNVSSAYGWRIHPVTGAKDYHKGVDIAVPTGTDVLAAHDGTVSTGYDAGGYGNYVTLTGSDGLVTKYARLGSVLVAEGQTVNAGDVIAKSGGAGGSTGPHLHFEVLRNGVYLNPLIFSDTGSYAGPVYGDAPAPMGDGGYAALLAEAERHLGKSYVFGTAGPDSFDCSGFISVILRDSGVKDVGRLSANGLYNICAPVIPSDARPGDLVFFEKTYSVSSPITHVGLYAGSVDDHPTMIHFGNPGQYARIDTAYWQAHFVAFGRINP